MVIVRQEKIPKTGVAGFGLECFHDGDVAPRIAAATQEVEFEEISLFIWIDLLREKCVKAFQQLPCSV